MAMTGGTAYLLKSEVANYGKGNFTTDLYMYVKEVVSPTLNSSTLYLGMYIYSKYAIGSWDDTGGSYIGLATSGDNCHKFDGEIAKGSGTRWLIENVQYTVPHNTDGSKTVKLYWKWGVNSPWGQFVYPTGSKDVALANIDRVAPSVSLSISNIKTNSFDISATADVKCNAWEYSLDDGSSWKSFSTTDATSASVTVSGLSVNTSYSVKVRARRTYNYVYGTSSAKSAKTLGFTLFNSCPSFYADAATAQVKPSVTVYDGSFTHNIVFKDGSTTLFTISGQKWTAGTATKTLTLTAEQKDKILKIITSDTKSLTVVIETYNGSTLIGSTQRSVTAATSNDNSGPQWESPHLSLEDTSSCADVIGNSAILVQGHSHLVVTALGVTARNYAKIANYNVTIGEKTVKSTSPIIDVGTVETEGNLTMRVTVTDSRGHSAYVNRTVTVLRYTPPRITKMTLRRANGIDNVVQLSVSGTITPLKPDGENNVNAIKGFSFRYKSTGDADYTNDHVSLTNSISISATGTSFTYVTNELLNLDNDKSFDFRFYFGDKITYQYEYYVLSKGIPLLALRKDKLGVNNPDPQYTLDVNGSINLTGEIYINGVKLSEVLGLE